MATVVETDSVVGPLEMASMPKGATLTMVLAATRATLPMLEEAGTWVSRVAMAGATVHEEATESTMETLEAIRAPMVEEVAMTAVEGGTMTEIKEETHMEDIQTVMIVDNPAIHARRPRSSHGRLRDTRTTGDMLHRHHMAHMEDRDILLHNPLLARIHLLPVMADMEVATALPLLRQAMVHRRLSHRMAYLQRRARIHIVHLPHSLMAHTEVHRDTIRPHLHRRMVVLLRKAIIHPLQHRGTRFHTEVVDMVDMAKLHLHLLKDIISHHRQGRATEVRLCHHTSNSSKTSIGVIDCKSSASSN